MAKPTIKVLVIDDHMLVHEALRSLLEDKDDMTLLGSATTGLQGARLIRELKPDVAVIDISLSDMNGLVLAQRTLAENPSTNVVILSMHEERTFVRRALEVGAKAYVSKRSPGDHILQAIAAAAEGGIYIDPNVMPRFLREKTASRGGKSDHPLGSDLTERESEVIRLIALGHTAKEIAGRIDVTIKSVETYKARACEKLNMKTRSQLVRFAATQGWLAEV
jgi:DNA-binding NarL/FixJ family response regulator